MPQFLACFGYLLLCPSPLLRLKSMTHITIYIRVLMSAQIDASTTAETTRNERRGATASLSASNFARGKLIATHGSQRPFSLRFPLRLCVMGSLAFRLQLEVTSPAIASRKHGPAPLAFSRNDALSIYIRMRGTARGAVTHHTGPRQCASSCAAPCRASG